MKAIGKFALAFFALVCVCSAQTANKTQGNRAILWSPPDFGWPEDLQQATVPKEMIRSFKVGDLPIILEETKLEDVRRLFGGTIGSQGDASEAVAWLCLHGSDASGKWMLWLTSGELEGSIYIDGIQWRRLSSNERPDRRCASLPVNKAGIALPIALHPGMKRQEVMQVLGRPTEAHGGMLIYFHEHQETIHNEPYSVDNTIGFSLRGDAVREIDVNRVTAD